MTPGDDAQSKSKFAAVVRVTSGNFLEQYDFFLFGLYASYIGQAFFPAADKTSELLAAFGAFGAGFLMRPLGAVFLGAYVDYVGRRKGLVVTLAIMAMGTILIAFVPDYAGVELGGVSVYLSEMATPGHKGFYVAWQSCSQQISVMAGAIIGYVINLTMGAQVASWAWRIPFIIGCLIVPFLFYLRSSLEETAEFKARTHRPSLSEIYASIVKNWLIVILGMLMVCTTTVLFYGITVYTPSFGKEVLHLTATDSLIVTFCVAVSNFFWLPVMGALSDRIGRKPLLIIFSALSLLTAYPVLWWLSHNISFINMLIALLWLSFLYGSYNGAMVVALTEVVPVYVRTAGFSLAYSLATAVFGGNTAYVATKLIAVTGDKAAPGYVLAFAGACGLIATLAIYRKGSQASLDARGIAGAAE
jgi:MHS family citrate/tricarballylate:H+ symporter-like MFS transporter